MKLFFSKDSPPPPLTSSGGSVGGGGGSGPNEDLSGFWHHFNLREQSEILQILVLYYANSSEKVGFDDLKRIWKISHGHRFGKKAVKMTSEQSGNYVIIFSHYLYARTLIID